MLDTATREVAHFCAGLGVPAPQEISRLKAGRNSEVFLISAQTRQWVAKRYFRHPMDQRDRLGNEYRFLTLLQQAGVSNVPLPAGQDREGGLALYSCLPGRRPASLEDWHIDAAAEFIARINNPVAREAGHDLDNASDACFSVAEHVERVEARLQRFGQLQGDTPTEKAAARFLGERLLPRWESAKADVAALMDGATLERALQILSPSDFGFHNALEHDGNLYFVDFEYAGWDDPAKLACDFICQPEVPVTGEQGERFLLALTARLPRGEAVDARARALMPVHRIKWCGIMLNEFLPEARLRRQHAGIDSADLLERQLQKAEQYFERYLTT